MSETPAAKASSDLSTRFIAGIVMAAVALTAVWYGGWALRGLVALAAVVMMIEWCALHRVPRLWAWIGGVLLAALLLGGIEYLYPDALPPLDQDSELAIDPDDFFFAFYAFAVVAGAAVLLAAGARRIAAGWGFAYVAIPAFALLVLSWAYNGLVFWVMGVTWATDIFAYFAGRSIGGPKLAPRVSPNKTWAGLIGGMIGAGLVGWGVALLFDLGMPFVWIGAPMAIVAQGGDLYESWVKRRAGVKDSGAILPGHGGVLDRLDGLLPVSLATFLLLAAGLWTG
ncbi:phosphatidate cytidylyltransferase [Sphingosinicella ginsenosidimutans]|uniref:Phosphatidate cytidylyltransferase n=1 Tax=Allosphingosinicella ginsenosidimutans TaxID=1176539 RepID=A0A5C6TW98_9SPHN|nr:phosphatidate cytidylyltransferase [Sphingosinicella ginsenosidimutans]TXC64430.1 phosphatidate cytidylyltransferase [Sphingosinicella ginsenosidimutans]